MEMCNNNNSMTPDKVKVASAPSIPTLFSDNEKLIGELGVLERNELQLAALLDQSSLSGSECVGIFDSKEEIEQSFQGDYSFFNCDWEPCIATEYLVEPFISFEPRKRCGQDVQRLSVVTSLPHLLKDNRDECLRRVIPKIREFLPVAQSDMQLAASTVFLQIFQSGVVSSSIFSQHFLPIVLNALDNKDTEVGEAWLETLLEVIPLLSKDVLRREVMTKAMQKGQLSQNIQSRLMSCRILGRISICLESFVIKKEILPLVQSLCQDVEYDVRACMCRQLDLVAKGLGLESTKGAILPELVELANDEESSVRLAGLDAVVSILSLLDDETCTNTIIPLVVKFCQGALQEEDSTLPVVSKHLGKLCHGLSSNMTLEQRSYFLNYYKKLCSMGRADAAISCDHTNNKASVSVYDDDRPIECRVNAAFNFPAMALFAGNVSKFEQELSNSFSQLCRDPSISVRKTIAHGFHEVSRCMGSHVSLLLKDLIVLFKDDYSQVLKGLVANLPDTADSFSKALNPDKVANSGDLLAALLSCEHVIFSSNDWRLQEELLESLSSLTKLFSSDLIYNKLVPRMFDKLHTAKFLPVRLAAVRTTLQYLRCNRKLEQRKAIIHRIITEFGQGKGFRNRTLFIDICQQVLVVFSRSFFKEYFYEHILELSSDAVPNIRLRLCQVMPSLKLTIRLPTDRNLLQQLESHVRKLLINERDRDVLAQLKITVDQLDRINCIHDSMHSRRNVTDEDLADQRKEQEESLLIELEEKEKKEEDSEQTVSTSGGGGTKKKGGEKKSINLLTAMVKSSSKSTVDKKQPALSTAKASKIPTVPAGKEPRRHSQHSMKTVSTIPTANGVTSNTPTARSAGSSAGRGVKNASSTRNVSSPNTASSNPTTSSAGSIRSAGRSPAGPGSLATSSPLSSAGRRRIDSNHENLKPDSIPAIASLRRTSRDAVGRKSSH
ncbi:serine/threonine-protein phosphatase 4 regulatory subunit 4-like [Watersipora subatra]|uniref:serine/threonine-protein phosphatase 4 regulatory subunit 4-like n=1 Tax=Watersipora subatra TaxID=2589382 RepID=UPI00355C086A